MSFDEEPSTPGSTPGHGSAPEQSAASEHGATTGQPAASGQGDAPELDPMEMAPHYYGGQAVIEGVMMRGKDRWAVAVRRPQGDIWLECHPTSTAPQDKAWLKWPLIRGCYALFDSLAIGMKALGISAERSLDEDSDEEELSSVAMGSAMVTAALLFIGVFIFLPSAGTKGIDALIGNVMGDGVWFHIVESVIRIAIFLAYLWSISLISDIRRVFEYHGAEHKTIAAWEHGEVLEPANVDKYSTLHVRCGTNFLILVMLIAVVVYTVGGLLVPPPEGIAWWGAVIYHVILRIVLLPVVAGLAYEQLKLGAAKGDNPIIKAMTKPGLWLQLITTKQPDRDQIEVAIRAFEAVVPAEHRAGRVPTTLDSPITVAHDSLDVVLESAEIRMDPGPDAVAPGDPASASDAAVPGGDEVVERTDGA
ncbi:MAG: DUF1385 domain-containing protein [Nitriliruptoraceae bacterium]|nr:DUF1385 domain-containing protein [Nitriliruptoraceae bacterium]